MGRGGEGGGLEAKEKPQEKPTLLTPSSWTSGFQNREKINLCCLHHTDYSTLL